MSPTPYKARGTLWPSKAFQAGAAMHSQLTKHSTIKLAPTPLGAHSRENNLPNLYRGRTVSLRGSRHKFGEALRVDWAVFVGSLKLLTLRAIKIHSGCNKKIRIFWEL